MRRRAPERWPVGTDSGWPPDGDPLPRGRGLPDGAVAVQQGPIARRLLLAVLPMLLLLAYAAVVADRVPVSRVLNPGLLSLAGLAVLALALLVLLPGRGLQVAGGAGWVARRGLGSPAWRVVHLSSVTDVGVRRYATRSGPMVSITMIGPDGARTVLTARAREAWPASLVAALVAAGARQLDPRDLRGPGVGRVAALTAGALALAALPLLYLQAGPFQVLPDRVVGPFTSGGCRAALAAEQDPDPGAPASWSRTERVGEDTWQLTAQVELTLAEFTAHTADPSARLAHLTAAGAMRAAQLTYVGPTGARIAVDALTFATDDGARQYLQYVNRATCERFGGTAGPWPGEVRWTSGASYGLDRWASGATVYAVSPVVVGPRATRADVYGLTAAAHGVA